MNPLQIYYDRFNKGDPAQKLIDLPSFPEMIDVEPVSACNYSCLMCPTGLNATGRKAEFMDPGDWLTIVRQCRPHGTALRLIGWGEPLLHPNIISMIGCAGCLVHLNTNASKIDDAMAGNLVRAGLASIKFSFQGVDRGSYAEMRQTDFFDGMLEAIASVRSARGDSEFPFIAASTSITNETIGQVDEFRRKIEPLVDQLSIGHTTFDYFDSDTIRVRPEVRAVYERVKALSTVEKKHPDPCPEVFNKLSIHADGSYAVCCNAFGNEGTFGNVKTMSISEAWMHPMMREYRERLARKEYGGPLCSVCYSYMGLSENTVE